MRNFFCLILVIISCIRANAQDYVITKNNDTLRITISTITPNTIQFKKWNNPKSQLYIFDERKFKKFSFNLDSIHQVQNDILDSILANKMQDSVLCRMAKLDAQKYYKSYKSAGTGVLIGTIFYIVPGLITAIPCSSTPPKYRNLDFPDAELMKNQVYKRNYSEEAFRIKKKKVWRNFTVTVSTMAIIAALVFVDVAIQNDGDLSIP